MRPSGPRPRDKSPAQLTPALRGPVDVRLTAPTRHLDAEYDRVSTRNVKKLVPSKATFHTVTTTDDPVIREQACRAPPLWSAGSAPRWALSFCIEPALRARAYSTAQRSCAVC